MAKKKKEELKINTEELSQTTLGNIKEQKFNPITLIVIFCIFLLTIFVSPYITEYLELSKDTPNMTNTKPIDKDNIPKDDEAIEIVKYDYQDSMTLNSEKFAITNLVIKDNKLQFTIKNTSGNYLNLANYNYYLEFYSNDTFIKRILVDKIALKKDETKDYFYDFVNENITKLDLRNILKSDYPTIEIETDDNGLGQLTCTKENEKIIYSIKDNKVYKIKDTISVNSLDINYDTDFEVNQYKINSYNLLSGFTTSLIGTTTGFDFTINIDLSVATVAKANNVYYYEYQTNINDINFEMEAQGFTCN